MSGDLRPAPMVPPECKLEKLPFMPVYFDALLNSDLWLQSSGDEFKAAFALWAKSWKQSPGTSLPNNDRLLAGLAEVSVSQWRKLREMALHNWVECSDGRLYHPFVARKGLEAWIERVRYQKRSAKGNRQRGHSVKSDEEFEAEIERAIEHLRRLDPDSAGAKGVEGADLSASEQGAEIAPSKDADDASEQGAEKPPKHKHKHKHKIAESAPATATAESGGIAAAVAVADPVVWKKRVEALRREFGDVLGDALTATDPDELIKFEAQGYSWDQIAHGVREFLNVHRRRMRKGETGLINSFGHPGIAERIARAPKADWAFRLEHYSQTGEWHERWDGRPGTPQYRGPPLPPGYRDPQQHEDTTEGEAHP